MWQLFVHRHNFFPLYNLRTTIKPNFVCALILTWSKLGYFLSFFEDLYKNLISPYFIYMHLYWQDLACGCFTSFFPNLYQSYGPWFTPKVCFRSISWEQIDKNSSYFKYAFILTKSSLLQSYVPLLMSEFVPAQYFKIFLLSIFRTWPFYCMKSAASWLQTDSLTILVLLEYTRYFSHYMFSNPSVHLHGW